MGNWQFRMYTQELPFVSRKFAWRSTLSGRHLTCFHNPIASLLENTVPFGFCCGGFSSTAGYVPGNEAPSGLRPSKRLTLPCGRSFPQGATRFYPGAQESLAAFPGKPFGFSAECQSGMTAACLSPRTSRHRDVRLSPRWSRRPRATRLRLWVIRFPSSTVKKKTL